MRTVLIERGKLKMNLFNNDEKISRKEFLKRLGLGALGIATIGRALTTEANAAVTFSDNIAGNIYVSAVAPNSTDGLWVDLSANGITKYWNGTAWVPNNKTIEVPVTLAAASWTGSSAPYSYTITVDGLRETDEITLTTTTNLTDAHAKALAAARISPGSQGDGYMTLTAFGTKPTIDIPIVLTYRHN